MSRDLQSCATVDEAKDIRDKSLAMELYARQAMNTDAERFACKIGLRAERKGGKMLLELDRSEHRLNGKDQSGQAVHAGPPEPSEYAQAKSDAGVSDSQAKRCEKLAASCQREDCILVMPISDRVGVSVNAVTSCDRVLLPRPGPGDPSAAPLAFSIFRSSSPSLISAAMFWTVTSLACLERQERHHDAGLVVGYGAGCASRTGSSRGGRRADITHTDTHPPR
jgi:hypothetical protein